MFFHRGKVKKLHSYAVFGVSYLFKGAFLYYNIFTKSDEKKSSPEEGLPESRNLVKICGRNPDEDGLGADSVKSRVRGLPVNAHGVV